MGRFHRHRQNFNPRFPRGKRPSGLRFPRPQGHFNPRFPRGKRPKEIQISRIDLLFQSTLPAREATSGKIQKALTGLISIHASREGSDINYIENCIRKRNFNPRFPRGKRQKQAGGSSPPKYFNPRFPRGKRPRNYNQVGLRRAISIHASRGGSDADFDSTITMAGLFQSTLPAGEATLTLTPQLPWQGYFNPRFPRGKRLREDVIAAGPPAISIHASRGGSD